MNILQLRFSSCLVPNRDDRSRPLPAPRDASHPTERASFGARALDSVRAESRGAASGRIMSSTAAPTEPGGAAPNPTSSSDGPSGDDSTNNADVDPHAAPPPPASSPSPHLAAIAASWSAAEDWLVSRPLRAWRVCHALSCLAMACARVNLASAVYLSLFVAQCSLGAGGRVGLYRGTSRRLWVSRTDRYRAWLTQRRLLALTALAAAANALAQLALHLALLASGTSLVVAKGAPWTALGVHRFATADDFARAVVPDIIMFVVIAPVTLVVHRACRLAQRRWLRNAVGRVVAMRASDEIFSKLVSRAERERTRTRYPSRKVLLTSDEGAETNAGGSVPEEGSSDVRSKRLEKAFFSSAPRDASSIFADVTPVPRYRSDARFAATCRALGAVACAASGAWTPAAIQAFAFLSAVVYFLSQAADGAVPRAAERFGSVATMRRCAATNALAPYLASLVEIALGGSWKSIGAVGDGAKRVRGSLWRRLCRSLGLWPMADAGGRACCMDAAQAWAWAWALVALALFAMGGEGAMGFEEEEDEAGGSKGGIARISAAALAAGRRAAGGAKALCATGCAPAKETPRVEVTLSVVDGVVRVAMDSPGFKKEPPPEDPTDEDAGGEPSDARGKRPEADDVAAGAGTTEPMSPMSPTTSPCETGATPEAREGETGERGDVALAFGAVSFAALTAAAAYNSRKSAFLSRKRDDDAEAKAKAGSDESDESDGRRTRESDAGPSSAGPKNSSGPKKPDASAGEKAPPRERSVAARVGAFFADATARFWRRSGDAVGAAMVALHDRSNGPLGGGSSPLFAAFLLSTSYPSLLGLPLLLWSMLPFVAPLRAAAPPRDFTGEVRQQKKTEAAVRDIARDEATDDPAAPPREGDEPSGANPPELEPEENAAALLDTAKGLSFDTRRQTLSTRTRSSASARASFNAFFARRTRSLSDFVEARVEGRYRKVHFFFASYAAALLLLDYASRLAAAVRYVDEADSDDVFGSALFFGPARRAAPGPSMLCKLALVALVARPHRARAPELSDEMEARAKRAEKEAEKAGEVADALEAAAEAADELDRAETMPPEEWGAGTAGGEDRRVRVGGDPDATNPDEKGSSSSSAGREKDASASSASARASEEGSVSVAFEPDAAFERALYKIRKEKFARRHERSLTMRAARAARAKLRREGAISKADVASARRRESAEEAEARRVEDVAERRAELSLRRRCRKRRRLAARRDAWAKRLEYVKAHTKALVLSDPGRTSVAPLWWVQYLALLSFAISITETRTILSGGNLFLLIVYVCSTDIRYAYWWVGAAYIAATIALQVAWLCVAEAYLITSGVVSSPVAEGVGLRVFATKAPLWASAEFVRMILLLMVVVAALAVNDASKLRAAYVRRYGDVTGQRARRWWLDDLGGTVAAWAPVKPETVTLLRAFGRFIRGVDPLGLLPVTLVSVVLCGCTPARGRPADLLHLLDLAVAAFVLLTCLFRFRNVPRDVFREGERRRKEAEERLRSAEEERARDDDDDDGGGGGKASEGAKRSFESDQAPPRVSDAWSAASDDPGGGAANRPAKRPSRRFFGLARVFSGGGGGGGNAKTKPLHATRRFVRRAFRFYIIAQCTYITLLYMFNVKYVNAAVRRNWPSSLHGVLVPDDFGMFAVEDGYAEIAPRILTLALVLFHKRWLDWRLQRDKNPDTLLLEDVEDEASVAAKSAEERGERGGKEDAEGTSRGFNAAVFDAAERSFNAVMRWSAAAYAIARRRAVAMFGPKFENMLQKRAMDVLLFTVVICVAAQVDLVGWFHTLLVVHAAHSIATVRNFDITERGADAKRGPDSKSFLGKTRLAIRRWNAKARAWYAKAFRRSARGERLDAEEDEPRGSRGVSLGPPKDEDVEAGPGKADPSETQSARPRRRSKPSLYHQSNDYGLLFAALAAISVLLKYLAQLRVARRGGLLEDVTGPAWGPWLGVPRLSAPRYRDIGLVASGSELCCPWPSVPSTTGGAYCVDWVDPYDLNAVAVNVTAENAEFEATAAAPCAGFSGYWWMARYQFCILFVAATQCLLQSRHNVVAARKAARVAEAGVGGGEKDPDSKGAKEGGGEAGGAKEGGDEKEGGAKKTSKPAEDGTRGADAKAATAADVVVDVGSVVLEESKGAEASRESSKKESSKKESSKKDAGASGDGGGTGGEGFDAKDASKDALDSKAKDASDSRKGTFAAAAMQEGTASVRRVIEYIVFKIVNFNIAEFVEKLEYLDEAIPFLQYVVAMALLLSSAFLKSNISSIFYIGILGYLQSENSESGLARVQRDGHRVVVVIGVMVLVHVFAALRPPDALLETDYCVDCPTRRFWLNFGACGSEFEALAEEESVFPPPPPAPANAPNAPPPAPPPPAPDQDAVIAASVNNATDVGSDEALCKSRSPNVTEYSIVPDLVVMLMLAYFIRNAKRARQKRNARMAWTRGLVAALGVKHELVRAGQYDAVVGAKGRKERRQEAAAKRKKAAAGAEKTRVIVPTKTAGEVSELIVRENKEKTSAGLTKNMSIPANVLDEHTPSDSGAASGAESDSEATESERRASLDAVLQVARMKAARQTRASPSPRGGDPDDRRGSDAESYDDEASYSFRAGGKADADLTPEERARVLEIRRARARAARRLKRAGEAIVTGALNLLASYFIAALLLVALLAGTLRRRADVIGIGYLFIALVFIRRGRDLRLNLCVWPDRAPSRWNIELFRVLPLYVYAVLAAKLVFQVPYFLPYLFTGEVAERGICVVGTKGCETFMDLVGVVKLGRGCDPTMMQDCSEVLSWERGGIMPEIVLFIMCAVQQNLFHQPRYHDIVAGRQRRSARRSSKATVLHVKRMIEWRNSAVEERRKEYADTVASIQDSAAQVKAWTEELRKNEQAKGGIGSSDGSNARRAPERASVEPKKPFVTATSPTSVKISWETHADAPEVEYFTVLREPRIKSVDDETGKTTYRRHTALPHYTHAVVVDPKKDAAEDATARDRRGGPRTRSTTRGGAGAGDASGGVGVGRGPQRGEVEIVDLTPGTAYVFVVHSYTQKGGHSTESEPSDPVETAEESEAEQLARLELIRASKQSGWSKFKGKVRRLVDKVLDTLAHLLDPAVYPVQEVKDRMDDPGIESHADDADGSKGPGSRAGRFGVRRQASASLAGASLLEAAASSADGDGVGGDKQRLRDGDAAEKRAFSHELGQIADWFKKGSWGRRGALHGLGRLAYSQSEWLAYASVFGGLLAHCDFFSVLPVLWVLLVALIRNPHPAPEEWRALYWYSVFVLFFRLAFQTNAFCMDVDPESSPNDPNHWRFSVQPICPSQSRDLFDPDSDDWMLATTATVMLTTKHRSPTLLAFVFADLLVACSVLLHLDHLAFVGIRTYRDMRLLRPCANYAALHGMREDADDLEDLRKRRHFEFEYADDDADAEAMILEMSPALEKRASRGELKEEGSGKEEEKKTASASSEETTPRAPSRPSTPGGVDPELHYNMPERTHRPIRWPGEYYREARAMKALEMEKARAAAEASDSEGRASSAPDLERASGDDARKGKGGGESSAPDLGAFRRRFASSKKGRSDATPRDGSVRAYKAPGRFAVLGLAAKHFARDVGEEARHDARYVVGCVRDFFGEIQLSNKIERPSRNTGKPGMDLYPFEFFFQVLGLVWLVADFSALNFEDMEAQSSGVEQLQSGLTIAILTSTISIVISRLVYMSQSMLIKYFMHVAYTSTLLLYVFVILPLADERFYVKAAGNPNLKAFVAQQIVMLMIGALQIRTGYREGSQHQTLFMKFGTGPVAMGAFVVYKAVPFLFEMRTLLDWVVSDSSLDLVMWFRFENIYHMVWKDALDMENRRLNKNVYSGGRRFPVLMKLLQGFTIFVAIIVLLLAPIFLFSSINPVLSANQVQGATLSVDLEVRVDSTYSVYSLYQAEAKSVAMTAADLASAQDYLMSARLTQQFDAECVIFPKHSAVSWVLPEAPRRTLAENLLAHAAAHDENAAATAEERSALYASIVFTTAFTRVGPPASKTVSMHIEKELTAAQTRAMGETVGGSGENASYVEIADVLPRLLNLPPRDEVLQMTNPTSREVPNPSVPASAVLSLERLDDALLIWGVRPDAATLNGTVDGFCGGATDADGLAAQGALYATMSDRFLSGVVEQLGLNSYSMLALYGFIFAYVGGVVRRHFEFNLVDVMIYEIPNPDYLLRLCRGLRMLRAHQYPGCRRDEVKLFYTLIQMLRSPDILIKVTRKKDV